MRLNVKYYHNLKMHMLFACYTPAIVVRVMEVNVEWKGISRCFCLMLHSLLFSFQNDVDV